VPRGGGLIYSMSSWGHRAGPSGLILGGLDRVLAASLLRHRSRPLQLLGSSIGTWRHACLSQPDPIAALERFEAAYVAQSYSEAPTPAEVSKVATDILQHVFGAEGVQYLVEHPVLHNHIVTARAVGVAKSTGKLGIAAGMGIAALGNAVHRAGLAPHFRRVVFSHEQGQLPGLVSGFGTTSVKLTTANLVSALKASGAIPLVLEPERNIAGAPPGIYWDGGIIDYHFALPRESRSGLILYPHFTDTLTPGWFDKFLPWRSGLAARCEDLVLISPSQALVESLPFGKIPDRRDFQRLDSAERQRYWHTCIAASHAMGEEFAELLEASDPLAGAKIIDH
jgi:hypothetical protein